MKKVVLLGIIVSLVGVVGCAKKTPECTPLTQDEMKAMVETVKSMPLDQVEENEVVVFETNYGSMVIQLFSDKACRPWEYHIDWG